jgi:hypothetical protein
MTRHGGSRDLRDQVQQGLVSPAPVESMAHADLPRLRARISETGGTPRDLPQPPPGDLGGLGNARSRRSPAARRRRPLTVPGRRLPERVEVAGYYLVSEALANAAKDAQASLMAVGIDAAGKCAPISIRDDGVGGADPARARPVDRVEARGASSRSPVRRPVHRCRHHSSRRQRGIEARDLFVCTKPQHGPRLRHHGGR